MSNQQLPLDFNRLVGRNLQRFRKAAALSQADLAEHLSARGFPFQQQTILKVEKGARPLKFDEVVAIGEILGVPVTALNEEYSESQEIAAATAQLNNAAAAMSMRRRQIAELEEQISHDDELMRDAMRRLEESGVMGADRLRAREYGEELLEIARKGPPMTSADLHANAERLSHIASKSGRSDADE